MIDLQAIFGDAPTMAPAIMPEAAPLPIPLPEAFDIMAGPLMAEGDWTAWEDCIDPPLPCPKCNGLELWQNPSGVWRCMVCDPPTAALRLLERVETARERKTVSQNQSGCALAALVDKSIAKANRPTDSVIGGLKGR